MTKIQKKIVDKLFGANGDDSVVTVARLKEFWEKIKPKFNNTYTLIGTVEETGEEITIHLTTPDTVTVAKKKRGRKKGKK